MKYFLVVLSLLNLSLFAASQQKPVKVITTPTETTINVNYPEASQQNAQPVSDVKGQQDVLKKDKDMVISVVGQGVAPMNTASPAQAYALAKRAAVADAYRLIAEKVKGVRVDGQDLIKNMMVKRSTVRTSVQAMVRNANIVETNFKEGLCEVEMEIVLSYSQFAH